MSEGNTLRFAFGSSDGPNSSIWRVWSNKNDIYVAVRYLAGDIKTSLHESGECQTSFTCEFMESDNKIKDQLFGRRHIKTWQRKELFPSLYQLMDIVIPHSHLEDVKIDESVARKVQWFSPDINYANTQVTFILSENDLGSNNWVGKRSMDTKLMYKGVIQNGCFFYIVYHSNNSSVKSAPILIEENTPEENTAYRLIQIGVDSLSGVGYLVDTSAKKTTKPSG
ncbi:MAG: hypothetical protein HYW01_09110 [Deltaproteobacteria bacterium]|nr:hypothetical protein [Deltaproteobacteria bacterium]